MNSLQRKLLSRHSVHQAIVKSALYSPHGSGIRTEDLECFGVQNLIQLSDSDSLSQRESLPQFDVLLIEAADGTKPESDGDLRLAMARGIAAEVGVCVILKDHSACALELLAAGADAVALAGESPAALAVAIFSAHNSAVVRRTLSGRVTELEQKIEQTKIINHAKSILAEQRGISEAAALRHLRHEARNQRRSMLDLAKVLIEAQRIISRIASPAADGKATGIPFPHLAHDASSNGDGSVSSDEPGSDGLGQTAS